jgi:hypothetical protein
MVEQTEYCLDLSTGLRLGVPLGKLRDSVSGLYLELVMANWKEWQLVRKMAASLAHS